nr:uncharacterized protein LOC129160138 [Nothobranchius furzeri]
MSLLRSIIAFCKLLFFFLSLFYTLFQHVMTLGTSLRQAIDLQGHQGTQGVPVPTPSSSGGMMREESAVQVPTVCPNSSPGQWQQKDNTTSLLHEVLVKQEIILQQQRGLTKMVQDLFVAVAALQGLTTGGSVETRHHSIFPLADVQALMALERELGLNATLAHELVSFFCSLQQCFGQCILACTSNLCVVQLKDTVWRVLKGAMTNALAKGITWRGQNGKVAFERLHLKGIVLVSGKNRWFVFGKLCLVYCGSLHMFLDEGVEVASAKKVKKLSKAFLLAFSALNKACCQLVKTTGPSTTNSLSLRKCKMHGENGRQLPGICLGNLLRKNAEEMMD